ncbi:hypothetical protein [Flavobacterium sp.]
MKKTLYELEVDDITIINGVKVRKTATTKPQQDGGHEYRYIYLKEVDGTKTFWAPAHLIVKKINQ